MRKTYRAWRWGVLCSAAACLLAWAGPADAGVILGVHDWESGAEGWTNWNNEASLEDPAAGGWLGISFPAGGQPVRDDMVYTSATNLFAGAWSTDMFVEFDFWAEDVLPDSLDVQWSSSTNSEIWSIGVAAPTATGTWSSASASFADWNDWSFSGTASEDQYLADLSTIDWIGVFIYRAEASAQDYQLDNFRLMIPEPAELLMLASALTASVLSLRRRKRDGTSTATGA
jgi:hypothetical protein